MRWTSLAPAALPFVDPALRAHTYCHGAPNVWYTMGVVLSAGGAFSGYKDNFARELGDGAQTLRALDEVAERMRPGADGVTFHTCRANARRTVMLQRAGRFLG